jgi:Lipopolysaccharide-assembly
VESTRDRRMPCRLARRTALVLLAVAGLSMPACLGDGHFSILGYSTQPNYDTKYHTVRVPIFKNYTFRRGLEFDLTSEVVKQIEQKTPYKVVSVNEPADTELLGTITVGTKNIINRNQLNEVREAQTNLVVELVWRDLQTGEILSRPLKGRDAPPINLQIPAQPALTISPQPGVNLQPPVAPPLAPAGELPLSQPGVPPGPPPRQPVVIVQSLGDFIPELGQSITTAYQQNVERLATQIVSMMEVPW